MTGETSGGAQTRVVVARGAIDRLAECLDTIGGGRPPAEAVVVADEITYEVAGRAAERALRAAGMATRPAILFPARPDGHRLHADYDRAAWLRDQLAAHDAFPVAVGAGTINDLTKLAAHLAGRRYAVVATAASMDGYAAFGAAMTRDGFKYTAECPAPRVVVADVDVLAAAPAEMTASGFGDLMGKVTAGADWLLADALAIEPLDARAWALVQPAVREAIAAPEQLRARQPHAVARLFECLVASGLAMQVTRSSRPASGAEHQLSHLWEMQGHTFHGEEPSHGFKVGVGTALVAGLYERVMQRAWDELGNEEIEALCRSWPARAALEEDVRALHQDAGLRERALEESAAKYVTASQLRDRLERLGAGWPALRSRLAEQLLSAAEIRRRLRAAGCPSEPEEIGLESGAVEAALAAARTIRRRYTVLDLAVETGLLAPSAAVAA